MDHREIGWDGMDWIDLALDRIRLRVSVNTVMNIRISYNVEKFLSGRAAGRFSTRAQLQGVTFIKP
jgi:hypothetical protein